MSEAAPEAGGVIGVRLFFYSSYLEKNLAASSLRPPAQPELMESNGSGRLNWSPPPPRGSARGFFPTVTFHN